MDRRSFLKRAGATGASLAVPVLAVAAEAPADRRVAVGLRKQLLVDDHVIAQRENVTRELGQAVKENGGKPVMVRDKPWESRVGFGNYVTVIHDGAKFRMWYRPFSGGVAVAESKDGLRWEKPKLRLYHFDFETIRKLQTPWGYAAHEFTERFKYTGKDNNLLGFLGDAWSCFLDPHETDPAHRFKAAHYPWGEARPKSFALLGPGLSHSPDGFRWTPYHDAEPVTGRAADFTNQILWDEDARVYRLYTREDYGTPGTGKLGDCTEVRGVRAMTNPDVKKAPAGWTTVRKWKFDQGKEREEHKRRQVMAMTTSIYEGIHFGLLTAYEWPEDLSEGGVVLRPGNLPSGADTKKRHERDILNFYVVTCRGDQKWDLGSVYAQKPVIPRGPSGSFDQDWVWPSSLIVTHQDRHWLYYTGGPERHMCLDGQEFGIGLATLRLDGFVYLQAKEKAGTVTTQPFVLDGTRLEVNIDAKKGEFFVEVLDGSSGEPLPGFSRREARGHKAVDELRLRPRWEKQADLPDLKGKVVRLKFHLRDAKLYAFQVKA
jgi:hypothetical protein